MTKLFSGVPAIFSMIAVLMLGGCYGMHRYQDLPNIGEIKTRATDYHDNGVYDSDVAAVIGEAESWIVEKAGTVNKPAIILDIDETSLSNWPELKANGLTFKMDGPCDRLPKGPCGLDAWNRTGLAEALRPTLYLSRTALDHNVAVFFITGRDETLREVTIGNLRRVGYDGWSGLTMRPAGTKTPSASDYKIPARKRIEAMGYHIIANIGDQPSDLAGGHADRAFLMPNPYYRIP